MNVKELKYMKNKEKNSVQKKSLLERRNV